MYSEKFLRAMNESTSRNVPNLFLLKEHSKGNWTLIGHSKGTQRHSKVTSRALKEHLGTRALEEHLGTWSLEALGAIYLADSGFLEGYME